MWQWRCFDTIRRRGKNKYARIAIGKSMLSITLHVAPRRRDASILYLQFLQKLRVNSRKNTTRQATLRALLMESQTQESHGLTSQVTWTKPCVDWLELKRRCWWTLRVELTRGCVQQRTRLELILRTSHSLVSFFRFSRTLQLHCKVSLLS